MRWFRSRLICHLLGHKWSEWQQQTSWEKQQPFTFRQCTRHGCLATERKENIKIRFKNNMLPNKK